MVPPMEFDFRNPRSPKPNVITPEERALIDAAVQAGRVRQIERGASGLPGYIWSPKAKQVVLVATEIEREAAKRGVATSCILARDRHNQANKLAARERAMKVRAMRDEGLTQQQIADLLGVSDRTVRKILGKPELLSGGAA